MLWGVDDRDLRARAVGAGERRPRAPHGRADPARCRQARRASARASSIIASISAPATSSRRWRTSSTAPRRSCRIRSATSSRRSRSEPRSSRGRSPSCAALGEVGAGRQLLARPAAGAGHDRDPRGPALPGRGRARSTSSTRRAASSSRRANFGVSDAMVEALRESRIRIGDTTSAGAPPSAFRCRSPDVDAGSGLPAARSSRARGHPLGARRCRCCARTRVIGALVIRRQRAGRVSARPS